MLKRSKKFRILLQAVTNKKMLSYKSGPFSEIAIDNLPRNKIWENRDRIKMAFSQRSKAISSSSKCNTSVSISETSLNSQMKDEYGNTFFWHFNYTKYKKWIYFKGKMDDEGESYHMGSFQLESGISLRNAQVRNFIF